MGNGIKRRFFRQGITLVAASLLMQSVSLLFNAAVTRQVGAEGMGLYALTMSVYHFAVTFATSGISLTVTRLCAEALGQEDPGRVGVILRRAFLYAFLFGTAASLGVGFGARVIGERLLGDARTVPALRLFAVSLVPIALTTVLSGYFSAVRRTQSTAAAQVFEQTVRMLLTTLALAALMPKGLTYTCLALVGGASLAELIAFFLRLILFLFDRKRHFHDTRPPRNAAVWSPLLRSAVPLALSAYARSGLVTVEHILIPFCLAGVVSSRGEALASYGVLHSMAIPLVLFPAAIPSAFSGLLVPEVAESQARGERGRIRRLSEYALACTLLFAIFCAAALTACADECGRIFYGSAEAGFYIRRLAPLIPVMYLDTTTDALLKGLGYHVYSMGVNIADSALSVLLVLLILPRAGAPGYVTVVWICEIVNFAFSLTRLHNAVRFSLPLGRRVFLPLCAAVGAGCCTRLLLPYATNGWGLTAQILLLSLFFLLFCFSFGCIGRRGKYLPRATRGT